MIRVGIFGGTFDPPHLGHVAMARCAMAELDLDETVFVPCYLTPAKKKLPHASAKHRLAMINLVADLDARWSAWSHELDQRQPVPTIKTLRVYIHTYPGRELYLLIGGDQASQFDQWQEWQHVASLAKITAFGRGDHAVNRAVAERIMTIPFDHPASSTDVRRSALNNQAQKLLTLEAGDYIRQHGLYE